MQFEELCKEHYAKIYNYILAKTGKKEAAEDLTQDVFLIALKKGPGFLTHEKPIAFLYTTAKNLTLEYYRKSSKINSLEIETESSAKDVFEEIEKERDACIDERFYQNQILLQLTKEEQNFYKAYYIEQTSMKTIAGNLGMSEAAVRMKYMRIRRKVKRLIAQLQLNDF